MIPTYEKDEKLTTQLKHLDPDRDLDAAHDAWIELQSAKLCGGATKAALLDRARKRGLDERRRRERQTARYLSLRVLIPESPQPDASILNAELLTAVQEVLRKLRPIYRDVVQLVDIDGFTVLQVALKLGIPKKTVYTRLARAHDLLKNDSALETHAKKAR